jgi:hypothetical protein
MSESGNFFDLLVRRLTITDEDLESGNNKSDQLKPEPQLAQCFMNAAKEILEPDIYRKIEKRAIRILKVEKD